MEVKAFQTKNLSIIFAEILEEGGSCCGGGCGKDQTYWARNPHSLTMVPDQRDPSGNTITPHLFPVFFTQVMTVDDYDLELSPCDYVDITDRFEEVFFDHYRNKVTKATDVVSSEQEEPDNVVELFTGQ